MVTNKPSEREVVLACFLLQQPEDKAFDPAFQETMVAHNRPDELAPALL